MFWRKKKIIPKVKEVRRVIKAHLTNGSILITNKYLHTVEFKKDVCVFYGEDGIIECALNSNKIEFIEWVNPEELYITTIGK